MANNISKRPRTAFLFQRLFLRLDGCLSAISERARPEAPECGHSHQKHSPASVFEAERAASFAANAFLPQPRRRSSNVRRQRGWLGRRTKERLRTPECNSSRHFHRRLPCRRFHTSDRSASTHRIVRLPHIESFGAARSTTTAPIKCGPASTPVRNAPGFDAQCGRRGGRNQRHKGTRALIPPSSLRLLAPIDATLRQKPSPLDRFLDTLFCGRSHTRRGQRFINLHNVMISLRNRSPGDDRETSPADRDFLRARQPECAAHPRKRNKEEIRPPIMDRSIVSLFSISFLM